MVRPGTRSGIRCRVQRCRRRAARAVEPRRAPCRRRRPGTWCASDFRQHAALDEALTAVGDAADLKSPWFTGHSRGVAVLASKAGHAYGSVDSATIYRAGVSPQSADASDFENT